MTPRKMIHGALLALSLFVVPVLAEAADAPAVPEPERAEAPAPPSEPPAPPSEVSGSTSVVADWHADNHDKLTDNDRYGFLTLRHQLGMESGAFRILLRIDQEGVWRNPKDPASGLSPDRRNDSRFERVTVEYNRTFSPELTLNLTGGDFYAQMGRGLVLALRRYDELGLDFALRGARAHGSLFEDRVAATVLAGVTNINNVTPEDQTFVADPRDQMVGGNVEGHIGDVATIGLNGVLTKGGDDVVQNGVIIGRTDNRILNTSASVDVVAGAWTGGLEYALQARRLDSPMIQRGKALYATLTGAVGPLTLLAEFKDYRQFDQLHAQSGSNPENVYYSLPPTAERMDQKVITNNDTTGGRLRGDMSFGERGAIIAHASGGWFRYRNEDQDVVHVFGGVRRGWEAGAAVFLVGGYRRGVRLSDHSVVTSLYQFEADMMIPLSTRVGLHINTKPESVVENGAPRFARGVAFVEVDWQNKLAAGAGLDWTGEDSTLPFLYPHGLFRWRASDRFQMQLLVGNQKGGFKCFAGICRVVPPFSGARLDMTIRY